MAKILHQMRLAVYPIISRVSYIPSGAGFQPSTAITQGFGQKSSSWAWLQDLWMSIEDYDEHGAGLMHEKIETRLDPVFVGDFSREAMKKGPLAIYCI